jgi:hypothetical protein
MSSEAGCPSQIVPERQGACARWCQRGRVLLSGCYKGRVLESGGAREAECCVKVRLGRQCAEVRRGAREARCGVRWGQRSRVQESGGAR